MKILFLKAYKHLVVQLNLIVCLIIASRKVVRTPRFFFTLEKKI